MDNLKARVATALQTAVFENGFVELLYMSPEKVSMDITTHCPDLKGEKPEDLISFILEWQKT